MLGQRSRINIFGNCDFHALVQNAFHYSVDSVANCFIRSPKVEMNWQFIDFGVKSWEIGVLKLNEWVHVEVGESECGSSEHVGDGRVEMGSWEIVHV